ncbi:Uncharacterised protein [Mycobacteroides abscessus subsp. abscessus]|nr:Uncharacterised protein [Mycobacteroides abscessus subsp. abscessus]
MCNSAPRESDDAEDRDRTHRDRDPPDSHRRRPALGAGRLASARRAGAGRAGTGRGASVIVRGGPARAARGGDLRNGLGEIVDRLPPRSRFRSGRRLLPYGRTRRDTRPSCSDFARSQAPTVGATETTVTGGCAARAIARRSLLLHRFRPFSIVHCRTRDRHHRPTSLVGINGLGRTPPPRLGHRSDTVCESPEYSTFRTDRTLKHPW